MIRHVAILIGIILTAAAPTLTFAQSHVVRGMVIDAATGEALPFAAVAVRRSGLIVNGTATDANGNFAIAAMPSDSITATFIGYEPKTIATSDVTTIISLKKTSVSLAEVRVTAAESEGARTSTSVIGQTAMAHLQPTSLTDIMALVPGGLSSAPVMGSANIISLREVPTSNTDYATSAIGTKINIDGAPVGADADLNKIGDDGDSRNSAGRGVDMRTIATDNIESVEVIRGIPSVRYGEVTSGVVNIHRRSGGSPLIVRLKADTKSRLASIGKGFGLANGWTLTVDGGILSCKIDPRNRYETFRRLNFSARARKAWTLDGGATLTWAPTADYCRNIDDEKQDPEVQISKEDKFRSSYCRTSIGNTLTWSHDATRLLLKQSLSFSKDLIVEESKVMITTNTYAAIDSTDGLPHDAVPIESSYLAHHEVDGRPFYSNLQLSFSHKLTTGFLTHDLGAGVEWQSNKNFGRGQVFDPKRPLSGSTSRRPRSFRSIPATNIIGYWVEDELGAPLGRAAVHLTLGVRLNQMVGLADKYTMSGRVFADPRASLAFDLPEIGKARINITAGWGRLCKMPTMDMLHPDKVYVDIYEMNYWNTDAALRRAIVRTYEIERDATSLEPAHNTKMELRIGVRAGQHSLTVCGFRENMTDAFRMMSEPMSLAYNQYDLSNFDTSEGKKPNPNQLPYAEKGKLTIVGRWENGSRICKNGMEWTFETPRLPVIATRLNISGAWFKTTRENSLPEWRRETLKTVMGIVVDQHYAGLYHWKQTDTYERTTTTITAESFFDRIGFIFSATAECVWKTRTSYPLRNVRPTYYVGDDGVIRPYTDVEAADPILGTLVLSNTAKSITSIGRPYATFNFKATKKFGSNVTLSFFADRLLAAARDYEVDGFVIRRSFTAYFGAQAIARF